MSAISELFAILVEWVTDTSEEMPGNMSGVWRGETTEWLVACNGSTTEEREGIPPLTFQLKHKTAFLGLALVNPFGGALVGPAEADLIAHFRALIPTGGGPNA